MTQNLTPTDEHRLRVRARIVADDERVRQLREQEITVAMTDAEIDGLSGDALDVAVADTLPYGEIPEYHTDLGAAFGLLLGCKGVAVNITETMVQVITGLTAADLLAMGPKESAAATICRAYLKLVNRGT